MNTFLARTGSNSTCFLAIKQSLPCGCVQFRGGVRRLPPAPPPHRSAAPLVLHSSCWSHAQYYVSIVHVAFFYVPRPLIDRALEPPEMDATSLTTYTTHTHTRVSDTSNTLGMGIWESGWVGPIYGP